MNFQKALQRIAPHVGITTIGSALQKELKDAESILELGTGPFSQALEVSRASYIGFESFGPYVEAIRKSQVAKAANRKIEVLKGDILNLNFPSNSFSHVVMIDVLEHIPRELGEDLLDRIWEWAYASVIIKTPNGFVSQPAMDGNPLQEHVSEWSVDDFLRRGYSVTGLSGHRRLRREVHLHDWTNDLAATMRWRPRNFWLGMAGLSQIYCSKRPSSAFELLAVAKL